MDEFDRKARRYAVIIYPNPSPDEVAFLAEVPDFPCVCAGGDTPSEALSCAYDGIASIIMVQTEDGDPYPEPSFAYPVPAL